MHPILLSFLRLVYPVPLPDRRRTKPLRVLALGLSRSGTDSLRQALLELGYDDVYHGFVYGSSPSHFIGWMQLGHAQASGDTSHLQAKDFDRVLGDCAAVTDIPAAGFAHELLDAYPDAKVILNYRDDIDAWHSSCEKTIETVCRLETEAQWHDFFLSFFQAVLFWRLRSFYWTWSRHFDADFARNGRDWYRRHYASLETRLPKDGYLKWRVEDGWEPLCAYLGKEVPRKPFPNGNIPEEFIRRAMAVKAQWDREARRNMRIAGAVIAVFAVVLVGYIYDRITA